MMRPLTQAVWQPFAAHHWAPLQSAIDVFRAVLDRRMRSEFLGRPAVLGGPRGPGPGQTLKAEGSGQAREAA
eukprot:5907662-Pyramimonas_sp.AAC.3